MYIFDLETVLGYDIYTQQWHFRLGEGCFGCGGPTPGISKMEGYTVIPMNGQAISFLKGDNTTGDMSNYTHITSNRGITLGKY